MMIEPRKRGRPAGTGKYDEQFRFRLRADDYQKLHDICGVTGLSISQTIRALVSDYISKFEVKNF